MVAYRGPQARLQNGGSMKRGRIFGAVATFALAGALACAGCAGGGQGASTDAGKASVLDPADPVQVELWTYYNGTQQQAFEDLVKEFNAGRGKDTGVVVTSSSQGGVNDLAAAVTDSAQELVGSEAMPDAFLSYSDTASVIDELGRVADLSPYLTDDEKAQYVDSFIEEGDINGDGSLKVFPVGKSTETLQINLTDWQKFADATGSTLEELSTIEGITAVASAPWGSALLFPITYGYIKMLGGEGLKAATEMAIVNADYMSSALKSEYRTYYSGETGRVGHEMILDLTHFKKDYNIDCGDIAHRLMDYGFHAPTLSFPVHETLMVEPTESEPKAEMDRFIEALVSIKRECEAAAGQADNVVANAPHTAVEIAGEWTHPYTRAEAAFPLAWVREAKFFPYVTKIDNGYGDRNLCCRNCE